MSGGRCRFQRWSLRASGLVLGVLSSCLFTLLLFTEHLALQMAPRLAMLPGLLLMLLAGEDSEVFPWASLLLVSFLLPPALMVLAGRCIGRDAVRREGLRALATGLAMAGSCVFLLYLAAYGCLRCAGRVTFETGVAEGQGGPGGGYPRVFAAIEGPAPLQVLRPLASLEGYLLHAGEPGADSSNPWKRHGKNFQSLELPAGKVPDLGTFLGPFSRDWNFQAGSGTLLVSVADGHGRQDTGATGIDV